MKSYYLIGIVLMMLFVRCQKSERGPIEKDKINPAVITDIKVISRPGKVVLTYKVPADPDLLFILAEYTDKYGKHIQAKASYYVDSLVVDGFADSIAHDLSVYTVDRSGNKSEKVSLKVNALTPPIFDVRKSLMVKEDFGGVNLRFKNTNEADLALVVLYKDSTGFFVENETFYTKLDSGSFTSRGFASKPTTVGIFVRDRWNNRTDTLFKTLTPIFEKELDRSKFKEVILPTDIGNYGNGLVISNLWDNVISADYGMWHSKGDAGMPMHITFDLGDTVKLSRFILWERPGPYIFNHGNPKRYEIWGTIDPPNDGSFNNWTLLRSCVSVKPSGQAPGINSGDDVDAAARGEQFDIPLEAPRVRFIRIKVLENWIGGPQAHIAEMKFFGNDN